MASDSEDPNEPIVARLVEESLAKYRHLLPPEALAELRALMEGFALTHPEMRQMVGRLRPRAAVDASDIVAKEGESALGGEAETNEGRKAG